MKKFIPFFFVLLLGCSEDFSPNGEYRQRLIVYGVMEGNSQSQMIRVYSTYSPDQYDPLRPAPNTEVTNASVRIVDGTTVVLFHDTLITVNGPSGNRTVRVYVNNAFQPTEGKTYSLSVAVPGYDTVSSSFKGIFFGEVITNSSLLSKPGTEKFIPVRVATGLNSLAYLVTITLEYRVGSDTTLRRKESPMAVTKNSEGIVTKKFYPTLAYRNGSAVATTQYETVSFETAAYLSAISEIKAEFGSSAKFVRAIVTLKQFDTNLYTYYSITNSFGGSASLRLDEPDYTNITNGFGVFGMMTQQDRSYGLPADF